MRPGSKGRSSSTSNTAGLRPAGRGGNVEVAFNLDSRLALKLDVQAPNFRRVRLIEHGRFPANAPSEGIFSLRNSACSSGMVPWPFLGVKIVKDQLIDFAASGNIIHVAGGRDQQFEIVIEMHGLLMKIALAVLEPADHPLDRRLPG